MRIDDLAILDDEALRARPLSAFAKLSLWALRDARSVERLLVTIREWSQEFTELVRGDPHRRAAKRAAKQQTGRCWVSYSNYASVRWARTPSPELPKAAPNSWSDGSSEC